MTLPPIHYISPTPWNLLGLRHWLPDLHFLCAADYCDGHLPRVAVASGPPAEDDSFERNNDRILEDAGVLRYIREAGPGGCALYLMFDERNEERTRAAGLSLCLPSAALRASIDDKIAATRLGDEAGVRSVPNVLGHVDSYASLRRLAAALGPELVVQLPFGDSGRTTFFIAAEADYARHAAEIEAAAEVKVMRRIHCRQAAIEACVTRGGIVVGPLCTELIGFPELTPYRGGWCGNELAPGAFSTAVLDEAASLTTRLGERLAALGYRGVFGLDFLLDEGSGDIYLGEVNPRITGLMPLTTQAARDAGCAPLMMFHLLEWLDLPHRFDLADANARFRRQEGLGAWSQLIIKELGDATPPVATVPPSGIWRMDASGTAMPDGISFDTGDIHGEDQALVCRTSEPGDLVARGTPIARMMTRGRMMTQDYRLAPRARSWISSIRSQHIHAVEAHDKVSS